MQNPLCHCQPIFWSARIESFVRPALHFPFVFLYPPSTQSHTHTAGGFFLDFSCTTELCSLCAGAGQPLLATLSGAGDGWQQLAFLPVNLVVFVFSDPTFFPSSSSSCSFDCLVLLVLLLVLLLLLLFFFFFFLCFVLIFCRLLVLVLVLVLVVILILVVASTWQSSKSSSGAMPV